MPLKGYKQTQEHIDKVKNNPRNRGEKSPRWKGGISNPKHKDFKKFHKDYQREYLRTIRKSVIEIMGGKCCRCGFSDERALQIDHVNGGGSKERKELGFGGKFHNHVIRSVLNKENKYQLLCANCNWIKRFENNERNI